MKKMTDNDIKLLQMDLLFDVKLHIKKKVIRPGRVAKELARFELEKELKQAIADYRKAKRKWKQGKLDRNVLFDYEWHIHEIKQEIEIINSQHPERPE